MIDNVNCDRCITIMIMIIMMLMTTITFKRHEYYDFKRHEYNDLDENFEDN